MTPLATDATSRAAPAARHAPLRAVPTGASLTVAACALAVLAGWCLDIGALKSFAPDRVSTKANTALCLLLGATALWLRRRPVLGRARVASLLCAGVAIAIATSDPGRMAPVTTACIVCLGIALVLLDARPTPLVALREALAVLAMLAGLVALMGYAYGSTPTFGFTRSTHMALPTAAAIVVLGAGVLLARSSSGFAAVVTGDGPGGVMARRLLPAAVLVPAALGWIRLQGQQLGYYDTTTGTGLFAVATTLILATLIIANAAALARVDAARRATEDSLRDNEQRLACLVETIADGIFILDAQGRITFANAEAEKLLALRREVMSSRSYDDAAWRITAIDGAPLAADDLPFARAMRSENPVYGVELGIERGDGRRVLISANAAAFRDGSGRPTGVVCSVRDVTKRREAERLKDQLVSTVSHELRTPLTSLRGFTELMLETEFPRDKQCEFLTIVQRESLRLTELINDFLDIERLESGRQVYEFQPLSLAPLVHDTLEVFRAQSQRHVLRAEMPESLPPVRADRDRLSQVLSNLLSNALKFSPDGGEVTVGARLAGEHVELSVADQGVGIPADALPHLFGRFFRVEGGQRRVGGTGLGLAIVKEIVTAHGGTVRVDSEPGRGSRFLCTIPVAATPARPDVVARALPPARPDVLLVEDDAAFARLLTEHFETAGLSVVATGRGDDALRLARGWPPRVILLDIHLAGSIDGWDVLVAVKDVAALRDVPVIIVSSSYTANVRGLALAGADWLVKPVERADLVDAVRRKLPVLDGARVLVVDDDPSFRRFVAESLHGVAAPLVDEADDGDSALAKLDDTMPDLLVLDLGLPHTGGFEVLRRLRGDTRALNLPVLIATGRDLSPDEKRFLERRLARLVGKREASLDYFVHGVREVIEAGHERPVGWHA